MISQYITYIFTGNDSGVDSVRWFPQSYLSSFTFGIPTEIILAVIEQESNGNPNAMGDGGASFGLMQVKQIAVDDLISRGYMIESTPSLDPLQNIKQGTAFLHLLRNETGSMYQALRAYNCCGTNISRLKNRNLSKGYAEEVMKIAKNLM